MPYQRIITNIMSEPVKANIGKQFKTLERLNIEYVSPADIKPNSYNPNRQSDRDFELLLKSMREDGFTQPVIVQKSTKEIVDGEHRWRASQALNMQKIPVVFVDMTDEQRRVSTLRHNRARGSEDIQLTAEVMRDLEKLGALDWAKDTLMLSDVEVTRLLEDIPAPESLKNEEFSTAWTPTDADAQEDTVEAKEHQVSSGTMMKSLSVEALDQQRNLEKKLQEAKNEEERQMARQDSDMYRISLVFSGAEAGVIRSVLGKKPAEKMLEMCKTELQESDSAEKSAT